MSTTALVSTPEASLGWLLGEFLMRVPGAESAVLASNDGLKLAWAGLTGDAADSTAALMAGLHSLAKGVGQITNKGGGVRQIVIEGDMSLLFVMSAGDGMPAGMHARIGTDPATVGTVLAVLAAPDADPGVVGHQMATLVDSVAEHLVTPTRRADTHPGADQ